MSRVWEPERSFVPVGSKKMKFSSTRGKVSGLTFEEAIFLGYASDGGLLLPEEIPTLDEEILIKWSRFSYVDLCVEVWSLFLTESEISKDQLRDIVIKAYGKDFTCPVTKLSESLNILELFHGKTKAFKDIPLMLVGQFLDFFLEKQKKHLTILVGTSGDTGSAAIESVRTCKQIDIIVLFPKGYCNRVQELQMTTVCDDNVYVFSVEGTSDDLDVPIKACLVDAEFASKHNLGSVNSINIGRLLSQVVFYFYAYFKVCRKLGDVIQFVIPTGAMGNVTAGCIAHKMGLPILLQCAVNENNIVHKALSSGQFAQTSEVVKTWSSAMDIQVPYNMERLLYLFSDFNAPLIASLMKDFEEKGCLQIPENLRQKIGQTVTSDWVTQESTLATMRSVWDTHKYLLCPHTAVGVAVASSKISSEASKDKTPIVCLATASPAKFLESLEAANISYTPPPEITRLQRMPTKCLHMRKDDDWEEMLRKTVVEIGRKNGKVENNHL